MKEKLADRMGTTNSAFLDWNHLFATSQHLGWLVCKVWSEDMTPALDGDTGERALAMYKGPLEAPKRRSAGNTHRPHPDPIKSLQSLRDKLSNMANSSSNR